MADAQILLYNFNDQERLRMVRRYLNREKISVRVVQAPEFLESLGYLFDIQRIEKNSAFNLGKNFQEEMMVMNHFSEKQMDNFLAFFRENNLPPVRLKAVLTPVTQHWDSLKLYEELSKEHAAMRSR